MTNLELRYDLRNPAFAGVDAADRAEAALEQIEWGERLGFSTVTLSEHHGSEDGYLPSPLVFAAAVAARTSRIRIRIGALIAPFHDPLRIAEDLAVLDHLSRGRIDLVVANGYVETEFEMFGRSLSDRVPAVVEMVETLQAAWTGEPFEFRGRTVRVTPRPVTRPASVDHAGRLVPAGGEAGGRDRRPVHPQRRRGVGALPGGGDRARRSGLRGASRRSARGSSTSPRTSTPGGRRSGRTWPTTARCTAAGPRRPGSTPGQRRVSDEVGLRDDPDYVVVTPGAVRRPDPRALGSTGTFLLTPMVGGIPPEVAWSSLRLVESDVLPNI